MAVKRQYVRGLYARANRTSSYVNRHKAKMATVLDAQGETLAQAIQAACDAFTAYCVQQAPTIFNPEQP